MVIEVRVAQGLSDEMDRHEFIQRLTSALSPAQAITDPTLLKGRAKELRAAQEALQMPGRHVFICGYRGVGKSSLALTTALALTGSQDRHSIPTIQCWRGASFTNLVHDLCNAFDAVAPSSRPNGGGISTQALSGGEPKVQPQDKDRVLTINEAAATIKLAAERARCRVAIIDEFDLLEDPRCHESIAQLVKLFADFNYDIKLIFCGVGESANDLMKGHSSAFRYFHTIMLGRLGVGPSLQIVEGAADAMGLTIERNSAIRIAQICDGFPYFAHLVTEKLLWHWFNDENRNSSTTSATHFDSAVETASEETEPELKDPYDLVVKRHKSIGEHVIWAVADGPALDKNIDTAFRDYENILDKVHGRTLTREQFNARLLQLRGDKFGSILTSKRRGWYEFTEKRMRGYVRLRAMRHHVLLRSEHPHLV